MKICILLFASQPSFLAAHQKQESTSAVSIPVSATTHFRAIGDRGPPSLNICAPQPGDDAPDVVDNDGEESERGARIGRSALTGYRAAGEQGGSMEDVVFLVSSIV